MSQGIAETKIVGLTTRVSSNHTLCKQVLTALIVGEITIKNLITGVKT
jgi:hypothetical protein